MYTHNKFFFFHISLHAQYFSRFVIFVFRKEVLKKLKRKVVTYAISYLWVEQILVKAKHIKIVENFCKNISWRIYVENYKCTRIEGIASLVFLSITGLFFTGSNIKSLRIRRS